MALFCIQNLFKQYGTKTKFNALNGISLDVNEGDIFGIIGLSGAGKSTLIRCMNMLEKPTSGKVLFDSGSEQFGNVDITTLNYGKLCKVRKSMGMIFQGFNLLSQRNVIKNVELPLEIAHNKNAETKEYAEKLLDIVGLKDKRNAYPSQLSGGQKQRVAIARALVNKPKVLLCDEPTSALDPETTKDILELLRNLNKQLGITIVIITHEMSVIERLCTRVAILDKGQIVESGAVKDVFANPQTQIAKDLILHDADNEPVLEHGMVRIVFDGNVNQPVISTLALELGVHVNISFASTKDIDGKTYGQMIVKLPDDKTKYDLAIKYFEEQKIVVEVI